MKGKLLVISLVITVLAGCDRTLQSETGKNDAPPVAAVETAPSPDAAPVNEAKVEDVRKLPLDEPILVDQLVKFDTAFKSGDADGYDYTFDSNARFLEKYPIWTDLDCQVDEQRSEAIWCAYGRMGEPEDRQLEGQLMFLANADVLALDLRCSQVLCINQEGHPVGVIQPQMRQWISVNCSRAANLHLTCN